MSFCPAEGREQYSGKLGVMVPGATGCLDAEYIMRNAELEEAQAGIKIAGRNINNLRYADGDGQGGLACCNSWGRKESDTIERLPFPLWNQSVVPYPVLTVAS